MSEKTRQLAQYFSRCYDHSNLSDNDEIYEKQIKEMFPMVNWDQLSLDVSDWKGVLIELSNSLSEDGHPQGDRFASITMMYIMDCRKGPCITWLHNIIEKLAINPKATLTIQND